MRGDYACLRKRCKTGRELRREDEEEEEELVGLASVCVHFTKKEFCVIGSTQQECTRYDKEHKDLQLLSYSLLCIS